MRVRTPLLTLAMILMVVAAPARAVQGTPVAECTFSTPMHFSPGISPEDGTGLRYASDENFSGAERGIAVCTGTLGIS